ncbi:MAG: stage III sporulation protein AD [Oscillospiraceae bacterium]|nr:stage III sporulation protein AD [Oscillospiraceae bacterium]
MIIKLAGIALAEIFIYSLLKAYKPEYAVISEIVCGVVIFLSLGSEISDIKAFFESAALSSGIEVRFSEVLLKALGTALIAQLAADSARDNGQSALAEKIELAGKVLILAISLPILKAVLQMITEFSKNR